MTRTEPISYVEATIRALEEDNAELLAEIERLRAELETANANCDRMAALAIDNAKDTERLRAALERIAANTYGFEPNAMSDEEAKVYFANLFFAAQGKARAALANDVRITAQPAAPGGDK